MTKDEMEQAAKKFRDQQREPYISPCSLGLHDWVKSAVDGNVQFWVCTRCRSWYAQIKDAQ